MPLSKAWAALLLAAAISACHSNDIPVAEQPALVINGEVVKASDFGRLLTKKLKNFDALAAKEPTNVKKAREIVLQELLVSALLRQEAKKRGITVTEEDVTKEFDRLRKNYPDDLTFRAALADEGMTAGEWRETLGRSLLEKKVFDAMNEDDAKADKDLEERARRYHAEHKAEFSRPAQVRLQQILLTKEDDAERLLKKLQKGLSFSDLAKKFSVSPDAKNGGDVGYISKGVVPAFDPAFNLKPGQLSGVIKSSYGFHIMKVLDKRPPTVLSYEQARERIIRALRADRQQARFRSWLEETTKSSKIERNDNVIEKIKIHTEGQ